MKKNAKQLLTIIKQSEKFSTAADTLANLIDDFMEKINFDNFISKTEEQIIYEVSALFNKVSADAYEHGQQTAKTLIKNFK